jgi:hypothetical protein
MPAPFSMKVSMMNLKKCFSLFLLVSFSLYSKDAKVENPVETYYLGMVTQNQKESFRPAEYCLLDEKKLYTGLKYRMQGLNLFFPKEVEMPIDGVYLIQGIVKKNLFSLLKENGSCDPDTFGGVYRMQQVRSDWLPPENRDGFTIVSWVPGLTSREALKKQSYLEMSSVQTKNIISVKKQIGDKLSVTITNSLEFSLLPMRVNFHYEGGRGKPSPLYKTVTSPLLPKGKSKTYKVKTYITEDERKEDRRSWGFRLQSVHISHQQENLTVDLTYPLGTD